MQPPGCALRGAWNWEVGLDSTALLDGTLNLCWLCPVRDPDDGQSGRRAGRRGSQGAAGARVRPRSQVCGPAKRRPSTSGQSIYVLKLYLPSHTGCHLLVSGPSGLEAAEVGAQPASDRLRTAVVQRRRAFHPREVQRHHPRRRLRRRPGDVRPVGVILGVILGLVGTTLVDGFDAIRTTEILLD